MNPAASVFVSRWGARRYTRDELLALEASALHPIRHGNVVDFPPFQRIPASLVPWLEIPHALEFVDVDNASSIIRGHHVPATGESCSKADKHVDPLLYYYCQTCASGPQACPSIQELIADVKRTARRSRVGALLLQSGDVVHGMLQMALAFEARQTSMRMRMLAETCPRAVDLVRQYLCGEGFHLALPALTDHDTWRQMNAMLKFDWIRDSKTRIFTELSKYWKKRNTQFEQFVHFFFFRDDRPAHTVKNMITHSLKPVMVAVLSGDVMAVVLLAELGFFVPPDYFWTIFPFFAEALDERMYGIMRHLCSHYHERQQARGGDVYNPIEDPDTRRGGKSVAASSGGRGTAKSAKTAAAVAATPPPPTSAAAAAIPQQSSA